MLRSLRNRLVLSHILPLAVILPLMAIALTYLLETRFILPQLARNLVSDSRLLSEISRVEYELWGTPYFFQQMLDNVNLDPDLRVMFLTPGGRLLYSSDSTDSTLLGEQLDIPGLTLAQNGQEAALTNYSVMRLRDVFVDVLKPVMDPYSRVIGIVRVTYRVASLFEIFREFRFLVIGVMILGLAIGTLIGSGLAVNIGRPVGQVTRAIYDLARGNRREPLSEQGPQELRDQIRAVNFLVQRLQTLELSRRQLLANLVHELGRPLGALRSAIQSLSKGAAQDADLLEELTSGMDQEAARLQQLVEDLAHLHDQVLGSLELKLEPLNLSAWLPSILAPWQQAAEGKHLIWKAEIPGDLPLINADPVRLGQVVGNLASNSIKYTPAGKTIDVLAGNKGEELFIQIADQGPGIRQDELDKIFNPFYRGDYGRRIKQGMGLGLSIAHDLMEAHGGRIEVKSTQGSGSVFTIYLPIST